jgi:hypothetical protein
LSNDRFIPSSNDIDVLFLINRAVDLVFFYDMFVQTRTPYRDKATGKLVRSGWKIARKYWTGWGPLDLISVIPFELLGFAQGEATNASQLRILRVLRLMKLVKLLRLFRASRKLKQVTVYINLRYTSMQLLKFFVMIVFLVHWFACGFRIAAERSDESEEAGWVDHLAAAHNTTAVLMDPLYVYISALYMSMGTISLIGFSAPLLQPSSLREFGFTFFTYFVSYFLAAYFIASLSEILATAGKNATQQDLLVDSYMELFDKLKIDFSVKLKVSDYLASHFAQRTQTRENQMLRDLPVSIHGFIAMEIYMDFIVKIPYYIPFIEREPVLTQTLCRSVESRSFMANSLLFTEGFYAIYYIDHGIVAIEGVVYTR